MHNRARGKSILAGFTLLLVSAALCGLWSCGGAPAPFVVNGPGGSGNQAPTLTINTPSANLTIAQGVSFTISWSDQDPDDNATISFQLINVATNGVIILVSGISENDSGTNPDSQVVQTSLVPTGSYNLIGIIDDGVNASVTTYATVAGSATQRVVIQVVGAGEGPLTTPPTVAVIEPRFDRSVTQGDTVNVLVRPRSNSPEPPAANSPPYDPDSQTTLFIILDRDQNPTNDDPFNPDSSQIIVVSTNTIAAGVNAQQSIAINVDLNAIPATVEGAPYFIRATISDNQNPSVHSYAPGTLSVAQLAAGTVDLFNVGRNTSGARISGFSPGANLGSKVRGVSDFDNDGVDDLVMVAQFGNPLSGGLIGEAYLLYGLDGTRFGGTISANSIGQPFDPNPNVQNVSGVIFHAPPVRELVVGYPGRTDGITDVDFISDLTGDGRPEILFGLQHVHGAFDSTDFDPADDDPDDDYDPNFCYPDFFVNNFTDGGPARLGAADVGFYAGGMGIMVNSQNRDDEGVINTNRLESTMVALELVGQFPAIALDNGGFNNFGNIVVRADNTRLGTSPIGNDTAEPNRIAGARFVGGFYDWVHFQEPPREDLFGSTISSISDITSDGLDEIIISSPRNERFLTDLNNSPFISPQLFSTSHVGSITILPGGNYNNQNLRAINDATGTSVTPFLDHHALAPFGQCDEVPANRVGRHFIVRAETVEIFAEDIDDFLGGGKSAGDFNLDGVGDILCSAPRNNRGSRNDTGAVYVIYGRQIMSSIELRNASNPTLRTPMLRIRGNTNGDQLGLKTDGGIDVNGDRIEDIFISSPRVDFGGITRDQCIGDFNGDGLANSSDLSLVAFSDCQVRFPTVFRSDACKAYDYDNDSDIDDDDRCVFCCLSGACSVDESCINGRESGNCCANMVDNGFSAVIFGGRTIDGDRDISQIATPDLPGVIFYGGKANDLAGWDISSAGDFNRDGFDDLLIAAPGETRRDSAGRLRVGVVYLVFGGTHLTNAEWNLSDPDRGVGSSALPGIVFLSPFVTGRPNEAAPTAVGRIGDINNDGFDDIAIGNPRADFIDQTFPQGPNAPGDDASAGRRSDAGEVYIIYGNNFGSNR